MRNAKGVPNAGGLRRLKPGDVLLTYWSSAYVYLGWYEGRIDGRPDGPDAGYLYVPVKVRSMAHYGWRVPGLVTDRDVLYDRQGLAANLEAGKFHGMAAYVKNPKHFSEKCLNVDLSPIWEQIQNIHGLVRVADKRPA